MIIKQTEEEINKEISEQVKETVNQAETAILAMKLKGASDEEIVNFVDVMAKTLKMASEEIEKLTEKI